MLPEVFLDSVIKPAWKHKRENLNNFLKSPLSAERQSCSGEEEEELQSVVFEGKDRKMESNSKEKKRIYIYVLAMFNTSAVYGWHNTISQSPFKFLIDNVIAAFF